MIIAITGYIGVGKTTTANIFGAKGFSVIEVDELGHKLVDQPEIKDRLKAEFGAKIMNRDTNVDRHELAKIVFNDEKKIQKLNEIVHPYLKDYVKEELDKTPGNVVVDVALFAELDIRRLVDRVILVTTDVDNIYIRMEPRYTKEEILTVMNNQTVVQDADYTVDNNGTLEQLQSRVAQILKDMNLPE